MTGEPRDWISDEAEVEYVKWLMRNESSWWEEGADPNEVREDLESHLQMKSQSLGRRLDADDLEEVLREMGEPSILEVSGMAEMVKENKAQGFLPFGWMRVLKCRFFLGVWPLLVIAIEGAFGIFGEIILDPISRWPQLALLLLVGLVAFTGQYILHAKRERSWFVFLTGACLVAAGYWGLLSFLVILSALVFWVTGFSFDLGLAIISLPIFLCCLLIAAAPIFASMGFWEWARGRRRQTSWIGGLMVGLLLLIVVEGPAYVTRYGLATDDPALVRDWGSKELLREIATQNSWGYVEEDTTGLLLKFGMLRGFTDSPGRGSEGVEQYRGFYYRVTGESVDKDGKGVYLASSRRGRGEFDRGQGGDHVGSQVSDLEMPDSRLDGHIDAASGLGYWEWTMEFFNSGNRQKEARMQVLLPPGGVVSLLTLWVDGEPQEAAFGTKSQVTAAYKSVVKKQRDPVLVRWIGVDRVMVQCFPVPESGRMKIRVGVTAPLDEQGRLYLPRLVEKNFSFAEELKTAVWVQGDVEMSMDGLKGTGEAGRWRETHGSVSLETLTSRHTFVACHGVKESNLVWAADRFAEDGERFLIREKLPGNKGGVKSVVLVVDGSKYFEPWDIPLKRAVEILRNRGIGVRVIYAAQEGVYGEKRDLEFVGGQDNLPALIKGLEVAAMEKADELIWIHGAQPVALKNGGELMQMIERSFHKVKFCTVDLAGGPNRLLEQLQSLGAITSAGRPSHPDDLERALLKAVERKMNRYRYSTRVGGEDPEGRKVWDQLVRWRVWEEVNRGVAHGESRDELAKKAAKYQLVTPVSGAVVLERAEQYQSFGLDQVDLSTVPSVPGIPEPSISILLFVASGLVWRRRRGVMA